MDQPSNTEMGHYFEWNTKLPRESSLSPLFIFQDFQFHFRIKFKSDGLFCTSLDQPSGEERVLPFVVNTYSGFDNHGFLIIYSLRAKSKLKPFGARTLTCNGAIGTAVKLIFHYERDEQLTSGFSQDK